jgi:mono/diheme cytochrome c family protein
MHRYINKLGVVVALAALTACGADGDDQGYEYAPQMYQSVPYESLTLVDEDGLNESFLYSVFEQTNFMPVNTYGKGVQINLLKPVPGTVARQNFASVQKYSSYARMGDDKLDVTGGMTTNTAATTDSTQAQASNIPLQKGQANPVMGTQAEAELLTQNGGRPQVLMYTLHKDSLDQADAIMNPLPATADVVEQGKHLYLGFCAPCHGPEGDGKGKVGEVYGGVPNYQARGYADLTQGHIFHVITHGKGRMWPHKSQVDPE